jgi:hypothetical protein
MSIERQPQAGDVDKLLELFRLERLEDNLFRGPSREIRGKRVFSGQVLGQALTAASRTVEGRSAHSLHAFFLRAGVHPNVKAFCERQTKQPPTRRSDRPKAVVSPAGNPPKSSIL